MPGCGKLLRHICVLRRCQTFKLLCKVLSSPAAVVNILLKLRKASLLPYIIRIVLRRVGKLKLLLLFIEALLCLLIALRKAVHQSTHLSKLRLLIGDKRRRYKPLLLKLCLPDARYICGKLLRLRFVLLRLRLCHEKVLKEPVLSLLLALKYISEVCHLGGKIGYELNLLIVIIHRLPSLCKLQ